MMSTADGKIGSSKPGLDVVDDYLDVYRAVDAGIAGPPDTPGNAWLCGRTTTALYFSAKETVTLPEATVPAGDFVASQSRERFFVTIDTHGALRWDGDSISFFPEHGELHVIVLVTDATPKAYLSYLRTKGISYLIGGAAAVDLGSVLPRLRTDFHIRTLLVEGGGKTNAAFLEAGLIDELHLLVLPRALNDAAAPSVFDGMTGSPASFALLAATPQERGSVLLHYQNRPGTV